MNILLFLAGGSVGVIFGAMAIWIRASKQSRETEHSLEQARRENAALLARQEERETTQQAQLAELNEREVTIIELRESLSQREKSSSRLEADLAHERETSAEKLALLQKAENKFRETFQALSGEALQKNNQSFLDLAKTQLGEFQKLAKADLAAREKSIGEMTKPIHESLKAVDGKLQAVEKVRAEAYGKIHEQITAMSTAQQKLQTETENLVQALRRPSVRGRWGELQLRRVVELAGMLDHCDFEEQTSQDTEDGRLRPDMIIRLPGSKQVIVDAKAPMGAYLEALEAPDESSRKKLIAKHAAQVRSRMNELGGKAYWNTFDDTPELVVMFLPGEVFFSTALQEDPELIEYGMARKVVLASPLTLIALLRAVAYGWQQERIAENAEAIRDLGQDLYDRICTLAEHFAKVGRSLGQSVEHYNKAVGSLESRALVTARRFKELGVPASKDIPTIEPVEVAPRPLTDDALKALPITSGEKESEEPQIENTDD